MNIEYLLASPMGGDLKALLVSFGAGVFLWGIAWVSMWITTRDPDYYKDCSHKDNASTTDNSLIDEDFPY